MILSGFSVGSVRVLILHGFGRGSWRFSMDKREGLVGGHGNWYVEPNSQLAFQVATLGDELRSKSLAESKLKEAAGYELHRPANA